MIMKKIVNTVLVPLKGSRFHVGEGRLVPTTNKERGFSSIGDFSESPKTILIFLQVLFLKHPVSKTFSPLNLSLCFTKEI